MVHDVIAKVTLKNVYIHVKSITGLRERKAKAE